MKKFLFTLAALLMAGSICAEEYLFINDFEVPQSVLQGSTAKQRRMDVSVMAHFDAYVNVWQCDIALPEGATIKGGVEGAGMIDIPYLDKLGNNKLAQSALNISDSGDRFIGTLTMGGYWYPEGTDPDEDDPVSYGSVKYALGEYEMFVITIQFDSNFAGGEGDVYTQPACGADTRGPVTDAAKTHHAFNITVEGGEPVVAEAPVFAMDENYTITATCANDYVAFINGVPVTLPYTVEQTYEEQTIVVSGYGFGEGMNDSETVEQTFVIPAKEMPVAEAPVFAMDENFVITATCANDYKAYVNSVEVTLPYTVEQTEEEQTIVVTGYGYGENMQNSETVEQTFTVPAKQVVPVVTPAPEVSYEVTADGVVVTATGEGTVVLYVDGEEVENPYTAPRLDEDYDIVVYATAQVDGQEMGISAEMTITVPAVEGPGPEDPHMVGYWLVILDMNGEPVWYELNQGANGDWTTTVALEYDIFGTYNPATEERPAVPFYFVVDGVRMGGEEAMQEAVLGDAMQNPLYANDNMYWVLVGYNYTLGIAIDNETGDKYVYAAQAGFTGLDEVNGGKTVAGVRYFNMAGQEMSEANGICIAVTTYTDGTTSAVKVMK